MLTAEMQRDLENAVLCWLATVDVDGQPSVSPKEIFAPVTEEKIAVAMVASPQTVFNLRLNPKVCLSAIDPFRQRGWKVLGEGELVDEHHALFPAIHAVLAPIAGEKFPVRSAILITPTAVEPIIAPSYRLFPETTEEEMVKSAMRSYGIQVPADADR